MVNKSMPIAIVLAALLMGAVLSVVTPPTESFSAGKTIATTSTGISPTTSETYQGEKRAIQIRDTLFIFYHDGTNIVYKRSVDGGTTLYPAKSTGAGTVATDAQSWSVVYTTVSGTTYIYVIYWVPGTPNMSFEFVRGTVQGSVGTDVSWGSPVELGYTAANSNCGGTGACAAVSATTDSNGYIYSVFRWKSEGASTYSYQIKRSINGGWDWSDSLGQTNTGSADRPAMVLTKLASGKMLLAFARYDTGYLHYRVFDGTNWGSLQNKTDAGMTTSQNKQISADTDPTTNKAYVAFLTSLSNTNNLKIARFSNAGSFEAYESRSNDGLNHKLPSTSTTPDGVIHIYSIASSKVYETKKVGGSWQTPANPYGTSFTSPERLTSAVWYAGALWFEGSGPSYNLQYEGTEDTDNDNDGIENAWETNGIDVNEDDIIDLPLNLIGAEVNRADIFVEIDFMDCTVAGEDCAAGDTTTHEPDGTALTNIIDAFDNAAYDNPAPVPDGINLHILLDDAENIPHTQVIDFGTDASEVDFQEIKAAHFGTPSERATGNWDNIQDAKELVYHYNLWAHHYEERIGSSGIAELPGNDLIVSLGSFFENAQNHGVGNQDEQSGTFMHELGHNLNLRHGGADDINCKPNYLSVMNYMFQFETTINVDRPLDYTRNDLNTLVETNLNEPTGLSASEPAGLETAYGPAPFVITGTGESVNWNRDGDETDTGVSRDINEHGTTSCPNNTSSSQTLNSQDDWFSLLIDFTTTANGPGVEGEMTREDQISWWKLHATSLALRIQEIDDNAFISREIAALVRPSLTEKLVDGPVSVTKLLDEEKLKEAIEEMKQIRTKMDGSKGGALADDVIVDAEIQAEFLDRIDRAMAIYDRANRL